MRVLGVGRQYAMGVTMARPSS